jgi:hypothetical protein
VAWLVDPDLPPAGERYLRQDTPTEVARLGARNAPSLHQVHESAEVLDHQVELVDVVRVSGMHGHFGRRKGEDQPPVSDVDMGQSEHIPQERPVRVRVLAVEDRMGTHDHRHVRLLYDYRAGARRSATFKVRTCVRHPPTFSPG